VSLEKLQVFEMKIPVLQFTFERVDQAFQMIIPVL
jgi:hypothetical protein